jgi:co-chaperonin GroES (HSP10)
MLKLPAYMVGIDPIGEGDKVGSIYKPDQAKGRVKQGIIKYIGAKVESISVGDYVFFSGYAGIVFRLEGEGTLIFMPEDNIIAIFEKDRTKNIPGLFFYGGGQEYFTATYEQAMHLITQAFQKDYMEVKERLDRKPRSTKTIPGKLFVIKNQEHMTGEDCFCMNQAKEYNQAGICEKCGGLLHYYHNKLTQWAGYHCENMQCQWNNIK